MAREEHEPRGRGLLKYACAPLDPALPEEVELYHRNGGLQPVEMGLETEESQGEVEPPGLCADHCPDCPGLSECMRSLMNGHSVAQTMTPPVVDQEMQYAGCPGDIDWVEAAPQVAVELAEFEPDEDTGYHPPSLDGLADRR